MALTDILIPESDPQCGILEIPYATAGTPFDAVNERDGIEELVLEPGPGGGVADVGFVG